MVGVRVRGGEEFSWEHLEWVLLTHVMLYSGHWNVTSDNEYGHWNVTNVSE